LQIGYRHVDQRLIQFVRGASAPKQTIGWVIEVEQIRSIDEATIRQFQAEWTPRGWAKATDSLTVFEQLLYLRQPGYGSCYITGKLLADQLITEYAHQQDLAGKSFVLRDFLDRFNDAGMIPILLMKLEMVPTGNARALEPRHP